MPVRKASSMACLKNSGLLSERRSGGSSLVLDIPKRNPNGLLGRYSSDLSLGVIPFDDAALFIKQDHALGGLFDEGTE